MLQRRGFVSGLGVLATGIGARPGFGYAAQQTLFQQPVLNGPIQTFLSATGQYPEYNPVGQFFMHFNQINPYVALGSPSMLAPVVWSVGGLTGLPLPGPHASWQAGIAPAGVAPNGHTAAQMYQGTVGAYLNSRDLIQGSPGNRMMIAPQYLFPTEQFPFTSASAQIGVSLDLQVPTATDAHINGLSNTYCKINVMFKCATSGAVLSYSCGLFVNGQTVTKDGIGFDPLSHQAIAQAVVSPLGKLVTLRPGSASIQSAPWSGWKTFSFTFSQAQFAQALIVVAPIARSYGYTLTLDPADYYLWETHLNAELHYTPATPATLGWSMRNLLITLGA